MAWVPAPASALPCGLASLPQPRWALAPFLGSFPLVRPSGSPVLILSSTPTTLACFPSSANLAGHPV